MITEVLRRKLKKKKVTCINDFRDRINFLIYYKRFWPGEDLHVSGEVAALENSMEGCICQIYQLSRIRWLFVIGTVVWHMYFFPRKFFLRCQVCFPFKFIPKLWSIWPFVKQNKIWYFWWGNFNSEKPKSKFIFEIAVNVRKLVTTGIIDLDMLNLKGSKLLKVTTISHNIWKMCNLGKMKWHN